MPSNGYLAKLFKVGERNIQTKLLELEQLGYIRRYTIKYKRYIEVLYFPKSDIEFDESMPSDNDSTNIELGRSTDRGGDDQLIVGGRSTDHPYIKDNNKEDIKETHTQEFALEQMLFTDFEQQRKAIELRKLCLADEKAKAKHSALKSEKTFIEVIDECVTHYATQQKPQLVSPQRLQTWIGRETRFQKQQDQHTKPALKFPTPDERAVNAEKILAREQEAERRKKEEIASSRGYDALIQKAGEKERLMNLGKSHTQNLFKMLR
jgi:hypothetical protein